MNRIPNQRFAPAIDKALDITAPWQPYLARAEFLCGVDPIFAGLHRHQDVADGRSYRNTAHCVHPHHQMHLSAARRATTIVLPTVRPPTTIVHELGHVLHEALDWEPTVAPVTAYAKTNRFEAFAEAWTALFFWNYADEPEDSFKALIESLALR